MQPIRIGGRMLGEGHPCFVIAEAGSNHNGRLDLAFKMIDVAAEAGADAVKFQSFRADRLYPRSAGASDYLGDDRSIYDIIKSMELPDEWIPQLVERCRARRVEFLCSAFDEGTLDTLAPWLPAIKIASYEMTHIPLVRHAARKGKPMLVSTGTAQLSEVKRTVECIRREGNDRIVLLQCTARYPAPLESVNAKALLTLAGACDVLTGLSDHSRDPVVAPLVAVALGASVIEKHYTLDNAMDGPDHKFAVEPGELALMVRKIREAESALGHGRKETLPEEAELHAFARRSIFSVRPIPAGGTLTPDNIRVLRCGKKGFGLAPEEFDRLLGRAVRRDIPQEELIRAADLA